MSWQFTPDSLRAFVARHPNPRKDVIFSMTDRKYYPPSYYQSNTRGIIYSDDALDTREIDNIDVDQLEMANCFVHLENAFFQYLLDINTHSQWYRPCTRSFDMISRWNVEARQSVPVAYGKRLHELMNSMEFHNPYWNAYEAYIRMVGDTPVAHRTGTNAADHFTINNFHFEKLYYQGS